MTSDGYSVGKQTTEWHDALVKHKIREKVKKAPSNDAIDTKHYWRKKEKISTPTKQWRNWMNWKMK